MESNQSGGQQNDHSTYNEEELMDRTAQAGVEGYADANPQGDQALQQMREDAEAAFGGEDTTGSESGGGASS